VDAPLILLADDEESVRSYVSAILDRAGYRLLQARDGVEALELARAHGPIDLVLTDVRMPRMDGIALANAILGETPAVPVIYISGYPLPMAEEDSHACVALAKPFTRQALLDAIGKCLQKTRNAGGSDC